MDHLLVEGLASQFASENLRRAFDIATVEVDSYAPISAEEMNGLIEENDVFVVDLNGVNSAFVENIAVQLKLSRFGGRKKVILLSNVLTWEKTLLEAIEAEPEEEEEKDEEEPEGQKEVKKEEAGEVWGEPDDAEDETWEGGLECSEEEEGTEALPPSVPLKESDYPRRGASSDYQGMIELENLFLSLREQLDWLGVHVVCPGVLYGREGVPLEELFELAWSQKSPLPVLGNGKNEVPCVHFRDLVTLVRFLAVEDALRLRKYVFAVDRNRKRCQGSLVRAVAKRFGPGKVKKVDEREAGVYSAELRRVLRLNLPLKFDPSVDVWLARRKKALEAAEAAEAAKAAEEAAEKEESPKEGDQDRVDLNAEPEGAGPVKLPPPAGVEWTCMAGLPAESESLRLEFVERRNLRPLKILVAGPPFSGKTSLARRLAAHYRVPYIHAREVVASVAAENSPSGERLRAFLEARIESSRAAAEAAATSRRAKGRPPQPTIPITKEEIFETLPETAVATLIGRRLCENDTRNNGYVLDGFPEHGGQARLLFLRKFTRLSAPAYRPRRSLRSSRPRLRRPRVTGPRRPAESFPPCLSYPYRGYLIRNARSSTRQSLLQSVSSSAATKAIEWPGSPPRARKRGSASTLSASKPKPGPRTTKVPSSTPSKRLWSPSDSPFWNPLFLLSPTRSRPPSFSSKETESFKISTTKILSRWQKSWNRKEES